MGDQPLSDPGELSFYVHQVPGRSPTWSWRSPTDTATVPVVNWSDLDALAQQCGVPAERIFIDDDACAVLDAA